MSKFSATQRRLAAIATVLPPGATPEGSRGVILGEALRLFAEHGYGGASIRDIAKLAGIKGASVYSHYPSKAHVLAELIRIGHEEHLRRIRSALLAASPEPRLQLIAVVRAHVLAHADYPMLAVVSNAELHALPSEFAAPILELRRQSELLLLEVIRRGESLGAFKVADTELALLAIGAMGLRVAHWYTPELDKTPEQIADAYGDFACRIVGAMN
ncbi:TetR/AcrR family transcriptional regulator [Solimonas sp. SE-A11]|uniref:TetR/AcrR family transcriptional regulator n=1 Tax=Solimonas sp. SE-A11 TaxID=3054954 RepID=UPI00259CF1A0|nr:TetR/AcrR family transcriptional regulator [Solimonas sp. SE-A11]MDM4768765.1 TetR/AcrR family transcriptional regulator [Solimonas sp. SE-A11]